MQTAATKRNQTEGLIPGGFKFLTWERTGWALKAYQNRIKAAGKSKPVHADVHRVSELQGPSPLLDIPLDIFFEILSHLEPSDFFNVTRVSKVFQQTLAPQDALSLWQRLLKASDAPDCPPDWNIARWVVFLFGSRCNDCGESKDMNKIKADYGLRKRLCQRCRDQCIIKVHDTASVLRQVYDEESEISKRLICQWDEECEELRKLTPSSRLSGEKPLAWHVDDLVDTARLLVRLRDDAASLEAFRKERNKLISELDQLSKRCKRWKTDLEARLKQEKEQLKKQRWERIVENFQTLGYMLEDIEFIQGDDACQEAAELSERAWLDIQHRLEDTIKRIHRMKADQAALNSRAEQRIRESVAYDNYKSNLEPYQTCRLPQLFEVSKLLEQESLGEEELVASFPSILQKLDKQRTCDLAFDMYNQLETVPRLLESLNLAVAIFRCPASMCNLILFGWKDVSEHQCSDPRRGLEMDHRQPSLDLALCSPIAIKPCSFVSASQIHTTLVSLIEAVGLDHKTATIEDMDARQEIFICKTCSQDKFASGSLCYTWRSFINHAGLKFGSISPHKSVIVSPRMRERLLQRPLVNSFARVWFCNLCRKSEPTEMTRSEVINHLEGSHQLLHPNSPGDFFFYDRFNRIVNSKSWDYIPESVV